MTRSNIVDLSKIEEQRMKFWCDTYLHCISHNQSVVEKHNVPLQYTFDPTVIADKCLKHFDERFNSNAKQ